MEYLRNHIWDEYYDELDPIKRKEIFERVSSGEEDDGANDLRESLYKERHKRPKDAKKDVDNGIWHMIIIPANTMLRYRITPGGKKDVMECMKAMGVLDVDKSDETAVSAVYWEIRNIAKRYFSTCQGPKYARKLFGMLQSSDDEKAARTAEDVWACAVGVPMYYDLKDEMQIFSDAVRDEFYEYYPGGEEIYNNLLIKKEKKGSGSLFRR